MNILEKMKLRRRVLAEKKQKSYVDSMKRKYRETGNKKWLHFLSAVGEDVDYQASDCGNDPIRN